MGDFSGFAIPVKLSLPLWFTSDTNPLAYSVLLEQWEGTNVARNSDQGD